jgi:hypothetical protein
MWNPLNLFGRCTVNSALSVAPAYDRLGAVKAASPTERLRSFT